jgi:F-type H+-transporting ATPase subunit epsilon
MREQSPCARRPLQTHQPMKLKILLPSRVFAELNDVVRLVAETREGSFGILPHRLDCVAALVPGILTYTTGGRPVYLAVDEGVLAKIGMEVLVSVRHVIEGTDLAELHRAVKRELLILDERERQVRTAVNKMEGALIGRFAEFEHGR